LAPAFGPADRVDGDSFEPAEEFAKLAGVAVDPRLVVPELLWVFARRVNISGTATIWMWSVGRRRPDA